MRSAFRLGRHPVHPMLIVFPSTLFPLLAVLDVVHAWTGDATAWNAGFLLAALGVLTTLAAMVPGVVDLSKIPNESRAHRTALLHAIVGTATLLAYAAATWLRWGAGTDRFALASGVDALGTLLVVAQGWLGGQLVYKHHVGVLTPAEGGDPVALTGSAPPDERAAARRRGETRP